jgi:hypothetical protein
VKSADRLTKSPAPIVGGFLLGTEEGLGDITADPNVDDLIRRGRESACGTVKEVMAKEGEAKS